MSSAYKLRCSLLGHSKDVRAITTFKNFIVTASRDQTAILWKEEGRLYTQHQVFKGHSGYVTSTCWVPCSDEHPDGLIMTGSQDHMILAYLPTCPDPLYQLKGHTDSVSCLTWGKGLLVSGSWDHTGRVWDGQKCKHVLEGHTGPVWAVEVLPGDSQDAPIIVSASADKTIRSWKNGQVVHIFTGHTDCIRGLSIMSDKLFLSCSNDATVRLWSIDGPCINTYYGHTNFIYSLSVFQDTGLFVTGSEDRTLKVWKGGECEQTIHLPAQSVWSVITLENGDIASGSSDGVCRIFTKAEERKCDADEQKEYEESVAKSTMAVGDLGGIKRSELPGKEVLLAPGKRDGQTVMVRDGDTIFCYSWSAGEKQWTKVGEVVGGAGGSVNTSGKVLYEGKEYDYVFSVDMDGGRTLKLPYNTSEDPYHAAQRFIHRHELSQDFLDQVALFIIENAKGHTLGQTQSEYYDPFTGGSRYVPGASTSAGGAGADPFTGGGRYVPQGSTAAAPVLSVTSSGPSSSEYFPQNNPYLFESSNVQGILNKMKEFNKIVESRLQLSDLDIDNLVESPTRGNSSAKDNLVLLEKVLQWPAEHIWPVLDILRLALLSPAMHSLWIKTIGGDTLVNHLAQLLRSSRTVNTQMLALRCFANLAADMDGCHLLAQNRDLIVSAAVEISPYPNKGMEIAVATLLMNYSVIYLRAGKLEDRCQVASGLGTLLACCKDPEAQFRALVGLGTLLASDKEVQPLVKNLDLKPLVQLLCNTTDPVKVGKCAQQLVSMM
ncbi:phospholipase A2 activator protein [Oratosquilla oratoria]|uniref:phospholipase A2 activator protein n=1 Tax=Oratosquilla oratoria TaxID=337810 RepID=UPI003F7755EC